MEGKEGKGKGKKGEKRGKGRRREEEEGEGSHALSFHHLGVSVICIICGEAIASE